MEEEFEEEDEELEREMLNQQRQEEEEAKRRQRQFQASDDIVMDSENDDGASAVASAAHFPATSTPIPVTASPIRRHPSEPEPAGFEDDDFSSISNMGEMIGQGTAEEGNWFEIVKYDAREFFQMVKALAFREYCTLVVNNEGIRLMVDDSHCQQASAYFKCEQFAEFHLRVVICNLRIPVNVFTEALNMFTSNSAVLRMWYQSEGSPLIVCVEDDGIVVQVAIRTMTLLPMLDFEFTEVEVLAKAILLPVSMREILRELDTTAETVVLTFTPNYVSFYTVGGLGKIKVEIPTGSDQLEHLSCRQDRVCFQYRVTLIKRMADCVRLCNKVSLRVDHRGVLSVQLLVSLADQVAFAEFFSLAEDDIYHPDTL